MKSFDEFGVKKKQNIPHYFNGFIQEKIRDRDLGNYDVLCWVLLRFAEWLRAEKITDLVVQYIGFDENAKNSRSQ